MEPVCIEGQPAPKIIRRTVHADEDAFQILEVKEAKATESIADARILVVAGRGVRKKEDLSMLEELAVLLGGRLASSRALVEKGWMPAKCRSACQAIR